MAAIALPPLVFDAPYRGKLIIIKIPIEQVHQQCCGGHDDETKPGTRILACSIPLPGQCLVYLPKVEPGGVSQPQQDRLRRHEVGHCNGWQRQHRGAIW